MSDTYTSEQHDQPFTMSPGEQLKRRREQLNISVEEAADALHLRPAVIAGLEHDSYDEIPVPTYRRGYLRAYAKYLDIDEGPVLEAYKARNGTQEAERKVTPVSVSRPPSRLGALLFKLVTLMVIIGLITVTVMWWQSRGGSTPPGLEDTGQLSSTSANVPASSTSTDNAQNRSTGSASNTTDTASTENTAEATETPTGEEAETSTPAQEDNAADTTATASSDTARSDDAAADDTRQDSTATVAATEDTSGAEEPATTDDEDIATADGSSARLELTFNQQSWTEIFDATNQRIFVGLQAAGTSATVEGEPPYRLTIGNSTGVELTYRGETVNLSERAGANNVARFTLGE